MQYLTYDGYHNNPKNKLEKAVQDYIKSLDRQLIQDEKQLAKLKKEVLNKIKELNQEHQRCKPIIASWMSHDSKDHVLSLPFSNFNIYHVKKEYHAQ